MSLDQLRKTKPEDPGERSESASSEGARLIAKIEEHERKIRAVLRLVDHKRQEEVEAGIAAETAKLIHEKRREKAVLESEISTLQSQAAHLRQAVLEAEVGIPRCPPPEDGKLALAMSLSDLNSERQHIEEQLRSLRASVNEQKATAEELGTLISQRQNELLNREKTLAEARALHLESMAAARMAQHKELESKRLALEGELEELKNQRLIEIEKHIATVHQEMVEHRTLLERETSEKWEEALRIATSLLQEATDFATAERDAAERESRRLRELAAEETATLRHTVQAEVDELKRVNHLEVTTLRQAANREADAIRSAATSDAENLRSTAQLDMERLLRERVEETEKQLAQLRKRTQAECDELRSSTETEVTRRKQAADAELAAIDDRIRSILDETREKALQQERAAVRDATEKHEEMRLRCLEMERVAQERAADLERQGRERGQLESAKLREATLSEIEDLRESAAKEMATQKLAFDESIAQKVAEVRAALDQRAREQSELLARQKSEAEESLEAWRQQKEQEFTRTRNRLAAQLVTEFRRVLEDRIESALASANPPSQLRALGPEIERVVGMLFVAEHKRPGDEGGAAPPMAIAASDGKKWLRHMAKMAMPMAGAMSLLVGLTLTFRKVNLAARDSSETRGAQAKIIVPKYEPTTAPEARANFTDSVLFTSQYSRTYQRSDYQKKWISVVTEFFDRKLDLMPELVVKYIPKEKALIVRLQGMRENMYQTNVESDTVRMRQLEQEARDEMAQLLGSSEKVDLLLNFHFEFFNSYIAGNPISSVSR